MAWLIVLVALLGLLAFWGVALKLHLDARARRTWPQVGASVVESGVESYESRDTSDNTTSTMYRPRVRYTYAYDGQSYESGSLGGIVTGYSSRARAEKAAAEYAVDSTVMAYVDPKKPSRAVLRLGNPTWFVGAMVGAGILWAVICAGVALLVEA